MNQFSSRHAVTAEPSVACHSWSDFTDGPLDLIDRIASHAALAAESVVVYATPCAIAACRSV